MKNGIRRWHSRGVTLILTVAVMGVLIPLAGLAIDASLLYAIKAKLQAAVDAASLAGARSLNRGLDLASQADNARATATNFFNANFPNGLLSTTDRVLTLAVAESAYRTRTVRADAQVSAPTYFMRILGVASTRLTATGMASRRDVNMVLVLDRSGSMATPMSAMQAAAQDFVDKFAEGRDNVGLIVFGGASLIAFPNPSPLGPATNFKTASPNVDTLIVQTVNGGNTNTAQALWLAYQELRKRNEAGALNLIVFFTDGRPNSLIADFNNSTPSLNLLKTTSTCTYRLQSNRPMLGYISRGSSSGSSGTTYGIYKIDADTVSSVTTTPITTNSSGCYFRTDATRMNRDVAKMPTLDQYGNATTGYLPVTLTSLTSPQQIENASVNAADSAVQRIRQDNNLNVVIYTIGYEGGSEVPDEVWMKRISNDPTSTFFTTAEPPGLYVKATTTGDLSGAFARVASEILRLAL
jgi:Flp pilus assembly protein TadG